MNSGGSGIDLARSYWFDIVGPLLDRAMPEMPRAAARVGSGSDVLGLDDEMSRDHDWGLRLQLFVPEPSRTRVAEVLLAQLPDDYLDHPTRLTFSGQSEPVLALDVLSVHRFAQSTLGFNPLQGTTVPDWLSLSGQAVLEITGGEVFEDTSGELSSLRNFLTWYPDDLWRYLIACDWQRIDQELPLMQRAGQRGDDLGSRVIAARLVDVGMHLGFLLNRRWAPYSKWRGTLFDELPFASTIGPSLDAVMTAGDWQSRGRHFAAALEVLANQQDDCGLPTAAPACVPFWDRPFVCVNPTMVPNLLGSVRDPSVRRLAPGLGSAEQRSDNVDLLVNAEARRYVVGIQPGGCSLSRS
ncbi:uncharacterized protein DUF4037 [Branchiibius hedensis]|uniref:DUF4037 domain-containing protein n=1 Tax=Branchiibius hedensis TaxID=672460 RepID=A0A2Y9C1R0_9MICO|nr:DUF4037 domain-containing protein [Branchiibius hedensis]PWJ25971.1 uncharacterized protein DUF4037 [Branchiibius hedensis]SSA34783.1 protein of unknown function [Branchiibius hedensis]